MRKEDLTAAIAPESFQTHERFVSGLAPKLAREFETPLILPAGRFHRPAG